MCGAQKSNLRYFAQPLLTPLIPTPFKSGRETAFRLNKPIPLLRAFKQRLDVISRNVIAP